MTTTTPDSDLTQSPPSQGLAVASPGFAPRRSTRPTSDPLGAETTIDPPTTTPTDDEGQADDLGDDAYSDATDESTSTTTRDAGPSRASTPDLGFVKLLTQLCEVLVGGISVLVRQGRQRGRPYELPPGVWLADDEDRAAIGGSLARIAARHAPMSGEGSDDVIDGFTALVGTANYAMKGMAGEAPYSGPIDPDSVIDVEPAAG